MGGGGQEGFREGQAEERVRCPRAALNQPPPPPTLRPDRAGRQARPRFRATAKGPSTSTLTTNTVAKGIRDTGRLIAAPHKVFLESRSRRGGRGRRGRAQRDKRTRGSKDSRVARPRPLVVSSGDSATQDRASSFGNKCKLGRCKNEPPNTPLRHKRPNTSCMCARGCVLGYAP